MTMFRKGTRLAQRDSQEGFTVQEKLAYDFHATQRRIQALVAHQEEGALVWGDQATGVFVSDIWKLDKNSFKPQYKSHRSVRSRWQVLNWDQTKCKVFRNKEQAIQFAQTCKW